MSTIHAYAGSSRELKGLLYYVLGGDDGVIRSTSAGTDLQVTEDSPQSRNVRINPGALIYRDAAGQAQSFRLDGVTELAAPENTTGSPRNDSVVIQGSALVFVEGAPPSGSFHLATVANPSGATAITNADITDERTFQ